MIKISIQTDIYRKPFHSYRRQYSKYLIIRSKSNDVVEKLALNKGAWFFNAWEKHAWEGLGLSR